MNGLCVKCKINVPQKLKVSRLANLLIWSISMIRPFPPVLKGWRQINCVIGDLADHHSTVVELTGQRSKASRSTSFRVLNKSCSLGITFALVKRKVPSKSKTSILLHPINITYTTKWIVFLRRIFWRDRFYNSQGHYFENCLITVFVLTLRESSIVRSYVNLPYGFVHKRKRKFWICHEMKEITTLLLSFALAELFPDCP